MSYKLLVMQDNPVAYWRQTENGGSIAFDQSGYENGGTYIGSPLFRQQPIVWGGDYSIYYGSASMQSQLGYGIMQAGVENKLWSFELWVLKRTNSNELVMGRGNDGIRIGQEKIEFKIGNFTASHLVADWRDPKHIVATYGSRQLILFVDGQRVAATDYDGGLPSHSNTFFVGSSNFIGEPAVYNYELPPERIIEHFREGTRRQNYPDFITMSSPTNYWRMNDNFVDLRNEVLASEEADFLDGQIENLYIENDKLKQHVDTQTNIVGSPSFVAGVRGQAAFFGAGSRIEIIMDRPLVLEEAGTAAFWFNVGSAQSSVERGLFDFGGVRLLFQSGQLRLQGAGFEQDDSDIEGPLEEEDDLDAEGNPISIDLPESTPDHYNVSLGSQASGWRHIVLTWEKDVTDAYINGSYVASIPRSPDLDTIILGAVGESHYQGAIDEFQLLPEYLDEDAAAELYAANPQLVYNYILYFNGSIQDGSQSVWLSRPILLQPIDENDLIGGSKLQWFASPGAVVQTSLDFGESWSFVGNGSFIPNLSQTGEDQSLLIRVSIPRTSLEQEFIDKVHAKVYREPFGIVSAAGEEKLLELRNGATTSDFGAYVLKPGYIYADIEGRFIEFWIRRHSREAGALEYIIDARPMLSNSYIAINSSGTLISDGFGPVYINGVQKTPVLADFPIDQWVHVVLVASNDFSGAVRFLSSQNGGDTMHATVSDIATYETLPQSAIESHYRIGIQGRRFQFFEDDDDIPDVEEITFESHQNAWQIIGA